MSEDEEIATLQALSQEAEAALHSLWEPRCLARAFATPPAGAVAFTMQAWIDLEAIRSPLLHGALPGLEELAATATCFGLPVDELSGADAVLVALALRRAVAAGFALALPMQHPDPEQRAPDAEPDGFGAWLPLFACLVVQCGLAPRDARALPVGEAYALTAALRRNAGWEATGTLYALRDVADGQNLQNEQTGESPAPSPPSAVHSVNPVQNTGEES